MAGAVHAGVHRDPDIETHESTKKANEARSLIPLPLFVVVAAISWMLETRATAQEASPNGVRTLNPPGRLRRPAPRTSRAGPAISCSWPACAGSTRRRTRWSRVRKRGCGKRSGTWSRLPRRKARPCATRCGWWSMSRTCSGIVARQQGAGPALGRRPLSAPDNRRGPASQPGRHRRDRGHVLRPAAAVAIRLPATDRSPPFARAFVEPRGGRPTRSVLVMACVDAGPRNAAGSPARTFCQLLG